MDAQTPLFEAAGASDDVDTSAASANVLNDSAHHERQSSLQGRNYLLSAQILHDKAERNVGSNFGTRSRER